MKKKFVHLRTPVTDHDYDYLLVVCHVFFLRVLLSSFDEGI